MDNEQDIIESSVEEKETVDAELVDEEPLPQNNAFDANAILGTIMQNQDPELKSVVLKLSTLSTTTKITWMSVLVCLLAKFAVYVSIIFFVYSVYCATYVLLHYNKVKENEDMIKDIMSKDDKGISIKKTVMKNLWILLALIPVIAAAFWYWHFFVV